MQKKIIALAIAGLASSAAFAQTNVTIYGLLDASAIISDSAMTRANYGFMSNTISTSRLGFKGTEDLGNGLKANFQLEEELSLVTGGQGSASGGGGNGTFNRAANVGIASPFGEVILGRVMTPTYAAVAGSDVLGANSGGLTNAWVAANINATSVGRINGASGVVNGTNALTTNQTLANGFMPGVLIKTPVMAGVQAQVFTNFGQGSGITSENGNGHVNFNSAGFRDYAVSYSGFGANVRASYQTVTNMYVDNTAYDKTGLRNTVLGADYTIAGVKLVAAYANTQTTNKSAPEAIRMLTAGASYQLGKANIGASYTTSQAQNSANGAKQYSVLAKYALSKRTDVYALYTLVDNHGASSLNGVYTFNTLGGNSQPSASDNTSIALGLRHSF